MLHLSYSNRTEALLDALAVRVGEAMAIDPLRPLDLVVPNRNMERYVELGIARGLGIAANLRFHRLERFVASALAASLPDERILDSAVLETRLVHALLDDALVAGPELAAVRAYLAGAGDDRDAIDLRRAQLALRLGRLFEEYSFAEIAPDGWQGRLLAHVSAPAPRLVPLGEALERGRPVLAGPVHVFGFSYVAAAFIRALGRLGEEGDVFLYTLNPCMEFWEDVATDAELRARLPLRSVRVGDALAGSDDPFGLAGEGDPAPLRLWGRPGREHVRLLNELTGCDFAALFRDPIAGAEPTGLRRLQHDILVRGATAPPAEDDGSVAALACPGVRREMESVAEEIWRLVRADPSLRFHQIAVVVNGADRDVYLPHLESVFHEASEIPYSVVDVPLSYRSRVVEAALLLLDLPFTRFTRPDVLAVVTHPAVRALFPDEDPDGWTALAARLGVFHGLDRADHRGTHIDRDIIHWTQGVRRVALGAFMIGEHGGERRAVTLDGEGYLPDEGAGERESAARFGLLVRSLIEDVRFARGARLSLARWADYFGGLFSGYLAGRDDPDAGDLRRCLGAARALTEREPTEGPPVSYRIAAELLRAELSGLAGGRGEHLIEGVVVSSFLPMRAIPFRVIFVTGLGEGRFPAPDRRDAMDLRAGRRRAGDVSPAERDGYLFLETLLCARERLTVSWVARDEQTGDEIPPSPVVSELLRLLPAVAVRRVPLRRHTEPLDALDESSAEAAARALGDDLRAHAGTVAAAPAIGEDLSAVRSALGERFEPLARRLALPPVPGSAVSAPFPETIRLSLGALRRFLESPIQGWARTVLGVEGDDDAGDASGEDEPFAAGPLASTIALREVFFEARRGGGPVEELYRARVAEDEARGRWPVGHLRDARIGTDLELLAAWGRLLDEAAGDASLQRVRFGAGHEHLEVDHVRDAITLDLEIRGGTVRVELTGTTEAIFGLGDRASSRGSVVPIVRAGSGDVASRSRLLRHALRGFVDHVALAASGLEPDRPHRAVLLQGGPAPSDGGVSLAPIAKVEAGAWLRTVAADLLGGPHALFFPAEAVLRHAQKPLDGARLVEVAVAMRDGGRRLRSGRDPIRWPERYRVPGPDEALAIARRRFGPFLRLAGLAS